MRRPGKAVVVTQQFDPAHTVLSTIVAQVRELARHVEEVVVISDRVDRGSLPPNARAHSFHSGVKVGRGVRFEAALLRELAGLRGGFVLAHMCPVYAILAAPLVRPLGVPLLLWHVHWKQDAVVRTGERVATKVVTVNSTSFPFPESPKLFTTGQAIDTSRLACRPDPRDGEPLRIRAIGRYDEAKGLDYVIQGFALAADRGLDARLDLHGPPAGATATATRESLERLAAEQTAGDRIGIHGEVARTELQDVLHATDLLVSNARGGADRIVYEASAACVPALGSNPAHFDLVDPDRRFAREDEEQLAERLLAFAATSAADRAELGRDLRERVVRGHSVESWVRGILEAAGFPSTQR